MSDESFGQDFMWYEWGFVSPSDFPRDETDATRETQNGADTSTHVSVQEPNDVWKDVRW
jgi:hypothetical protein